MVPGEGDVFKNDPDHERYEHTNVDYLRLNRVSRFDGGWQPVPDGSKVEARFDLKWTFPRSCAQIIMGDGKSVKRQQVDLRNTGSFGEQSFRTSVDVTGQR